MSVHKTALSERELANLARDLDAVRREVTEDLGERDVKYIHRILAVVRYLAVLGRGLLWLCWLPLGSWWLPMSIALGTVFLGLSKILSDMEAGHNILHGQFDWTNDEKLQGFSYEWDCMCTGDNWRLSHNFLHHHYTNVLGMDHDLGYGFFRVRTEQPWYPIYLLQPFYVIIVAFIFQFGVCVQTWRIEEVLVTRTASLREKFKQANFYLPKIYRQLFKDYVFFPALAGPYFFYVFLGNLIANGMRNLWIAVVIFCGHFPKDVQVFSKDVLENESKGHWYYRQILGSSNFNGSRLLHIMAGNLSHQIEHHLFPDLPCNRYVEIAPRVREICAKYGLAYDTGPFYKQLGEVFWQIIKCSLPIGTLGDRKAVKKDLKGVANS
ncbi:MAG: acyl-CoA desaturase [Neisseriaceae bacterium]